MINYNEKAKEIYEQNKAVGRCIYQTLQLVSTEIAEATEGERKNLMDDHLPHRKMGEVELADALIRTLDLGGRYGWHWHCAGASHQIPELSDPGMTIGGKHLLINACLIGLMHNLPRDLELPDGPVHHHYTQLICAIVSTSCSRGYDIEAAMGEKLEYNRQRAGHKRANRAKANGKKF